VTEILEECTTSKTLEMELMLFSETLVNLYQTTLFHVQEYAILHHYMKQEFTDKPNSRCEECFKYKAGPHIYFCCGCLGGDVM
jgi:hypothetical protein